MKIDCADCGALVEVVGCDDEDDDVMVMILEEHGCGGGENPPEGE